MEGLGIDRTISEFTLMEQDECELDLSGSGMDKLVVIMNMAIKIWVP